MEKEGSLKIIHHEKGDLLESSIGKILSIIQHLGAASYGSYMKEIPPERAVELAKQFEDVDWQGDVEVHLNHSPIFHQLKRLFSSDRQTNIFSRALVGLPVTVGMGTLGKMMNFNFYNPYTETVQLYNENPYIASSRLTMAEMIDRQDSKLKKEGLAFASSIPVFFNTIPSSIANWETIKKYEGVQKAEATKYLGSNSIGELTVDAVGLLGILVAAGNIEAIEPYVPDLNFGEQLALSSSLVLGSSLLLEGQKRKMINESNIFFDPEVDLVLDSSNNNNKKKANLPAGVRLNALAS